MTTTTQNHTLTRKFSKTTQIFLKHKFKYFIPIISNPEALQKIFTATGDSKYQTFLNEVGKDGNITTIEKLSELIQSTTTKGNFTYEMIRDYHDITNIGNYLKITYIKASEFSDKFKSLQIPNDTPQTLTTTNSHNSILNDTDINEIIFSQDKIKSIQDSQKQKGNNSDNNNLTQEEIKSGITGINEVKGDKIFHSKQNPGLSVIQVIDPNLRACLKQSQELSVFFNLINTIDMSLAMPYLNIKFLVPATIKSNGESRDYMVASFNNLLFGSKADSTKNSELYTNTAKAISGDIYRDVYTYQQLRNKDNIIEVSTSSTSRASTNDIPPTQSQTSTKVGEYETISVERRVVDLGIFTSPQTLVNGDEGLYGDYNSFDNLDTINATRINPVQDKFRPFMSIESIDFDVRPTKELMSFKTATINLILYDKGRLNDVLPFVKPDLLGSFGSEILLEYGWQHILGDTEFVSENEISPIAEFINSLKNFEKYQIVNSSYSIQENGQVNITLNISMKGPIDLRGTQVHNQLFDLYIIDNQINLLMKNIANSKYTDTSTDKIYLELQPNMKSLLDTPDAQNIQKLLNDYTKFTKEIIDNEAQPGSKAVFQSLAKKTIASIKELQKKFDGLNNSIDKKLQDGLLNFLDSDKDPFLIEKPFIGQYNEKTEFKKGEYVSLGKVILSLLGKLMAATYKFDEIQLIFFNLNEKAIRARHLNIAQIPVNKEDFKTYISNILKFTKQLSIEGLINSILKRYVNEKAAEVYGLQNILVFNDSSETVFKIEKELASQQNKSKATSSQIAEHEASIANEISKQYGYIDDQGKFIDSENQHEYDLTFKLPMIRMTFDTLIHPSSDESLILRVNFYDEHDNPFESMFDLLNNFQHKKLTNAISTIQYLSTEFQSKGGTVSPTNGDKMKKIKTRFESMLKFLIKENIVTMYTNDNNSTDNLIDAINIKINTTSFTELSKDRSFNSLKTMFKELLPSITFGAPNSAAISANVSSMQDAKLSTVFMTRDEQQSAKGMKYQLMEDMNMMPTRVIPSQVSAKIIGCPIVNFGQMIFFDFNTGTTIDNAYIVTGIKHSIGPGKFETDLTLTLADSYARFLMSTSTIKTFFEMARNFDQSNKNKNPLDQQGNLNQINAVRQRQDQIKQIVNATGKLLIRFGFNTI